MPRRWIGFAGSWIWKFKSVIRTKPIRFWSGWTRTRQKNKNKIGLGWFGSIQIHRLPEPVLTPTYYVVDTSGLPPSTTSHHANPPLTRTWFVDYKVHHLALHWLVAFQLIPHRTALPLSTRPTPHRSPAWPSPSSQIFTKPDWVGSTHISFGSHIFWSSPI